MGRWVLPLDSSRSDDPCGVSSFLSRKENRYLSGGSNQAESSSIDVKCAEDSVFVSMCGAKSLTKRSPIHSDFADFPDK